MPVLQRKLNTFFGSFGQILVLGGAAAGELLHLPVSSAYLFELVLEQILGLGIRSMLLVGVTGVATGTVFALQLGYGLERFGGNVYIPTVVGLAILRELGPVLSGLLLAGRIGSGITAELSSMAVTRQLEAVRALGTSPIATLVLPRIIGCLIVFPILTALSDYVAILSAMVVSRGQFGVGMRFFVSKFLQSCSVADLVTGLVKALVFGLGIGFLACWKGIGTTGGTRGVGLSTTQVVVWSSIFILVSDVFMSKFFISAGLFSGWS
jgi:phospholipid/cholesterol/gamma-HCH transport system permease protein